MKYAVVNLGCKVNRVESDAFASSLDAHGAKSCDVADADLIVVNTCTVTGEAEKKTRKAFSITRRFSARSLPGTLRVGAAFLMQAVVPA